MGVLVPIAQFPRHSLACLSLCVVSSRACASPDRYGIFKRGSEYVGKTAGITGGHLTGDEMAASLGRALGSEVRYNAVSPEAYRNFGFPGAEDLGNMFQFKGDFNEYFCGVRTPDEARSLNPALQSFDGWLAENGKRIPLE